MSVESKAATVATITSAGILALSAGTLIVKEVFRRREVKQSREYMEQSAGDSRILFQRDSVKLR